MSFSYSKVSTFWDCPFKYKLIYIDKLKAKDNNNPDNPLFTGTAIHEGIEKKSIAAAIENYKSNFNEFDKRHDLEILKIQTILKNAIDQIPRGEYEYELLGDDGFTGFIDCLVKVDEGIYDVLDFKHSNNTDGYKESPQVLLYKYYFEKLTGFKVRNMYYVFIPKYTKKLSESFSEDEYESILSDIKENYSKSNVVFVKVEYDEDKVKAFMTKKRLMEIAKTYEKKSGFGCKWCEFRKYCASNGKDKSELKDNDVDIKVVNKPTPMESLF